MERRDTRGLPVGMRVEVRTRYLESWTHGFDIVEVNAGGYRVRRRSDRTVLPVEFHPEDVRPDAGLAHR